MPFNTPFHAPTDSEIEAADMQSLFELEFHDLFSLPNLVRAHNKARTGKNYRDEVYLFERNLLANLSAIRNRVLSGSYRFGPYREFILFDTKRRHIVTSPHKDRVVHWVLYSYLYPIFDRGFIHDSYGNREGKGVLKGATRAREFIQKRNNQYVLKIDFSKYFYSVRHDVLLGMLDAKVRNPLVTNLLEDLITSFKTGDLYDHLFHEESLYRTTEYKGMPLGSLTSQLFANIYLNRLDHYCKDALKIESYLRYVDDIVILGTHKHDLAKKLGQIESFSRERLGLEIHPGKVRIFPKSQGLDFLGYRIYPYRTLIRKRTQRRIRRALLSENSGQITSYYGICKHSDSHLRRKVEVVAGLKTRGAR